MSIQIEAPAVDPEAVEEFLGRVTVDAAATMTTVMCALGDRLGLFRALAGGPCTSVELARRAGVDERYAREWCSVLTTAGYVTHDGAASTYALPAEHAPVLADDGGPFSFGGMHQMLRGILALIDPIRSTSAPAAASRSRPTTTTSGAAWSARRASASTTCSCRSGSRRSPGWRPSWQRARTWPTSAAGRGAR